MMEPMHDVRCEFKGCTTTPAEDDVYVFVLADDPARKLWVLCYDHLDETGRFDAPTT